MVGSKDDAIKIKEYINEKKVVLIKEQTNLIEGRKKETYAYSSLEEKSNHELVMKEKGFNKNILDYYVLYDNIFEPNSKISVIAGKYTNDNYFGSFLDTKKDIDGENTIETVATIIEMVQNNRFKVELESGYKLIAELSEQLLQDNIELLINDKVKISISTLNSASIEGYSKNVILSKVIN